MQPPNPVLPGFHPDPSIVHVDGTYYVVTSSFEYLPGLPVHASDDLVTWRLVSHVATRPEQLGLATTFTPGGAWAPTIRHRDGRFYVIVASFLGGRGCVLFSATTAAGPWDDGVVIGAVDGIDPDLAWDAGGSAYVTFSKMGGGVRQVRVDLATGTALEEPRDLWTGTGMFAAEGPHLYERDGSWYLLVAEGGTDRGHAVSIARGPSPMGPFEPCPHNPIITARSTDLEVQNLGHADLVETPTGTAMVLLGVRPLGIGMAFSPLGRETFLTTVTWEGGWPVVAVPEPVPAADDVKVVLDPADPGALDEWVAVRRSSAGFVTVDRDAVVLAGDAPVGSPLPAFLGLRQSHHAATFSAVVDVSAGSGGLALRLREDHIVAIHASPAAEGVRVETRAILSHLENRSSVDVPTGPVLLEFELVPNPAGFRTREMTCDLIRLSVVVDGERSVLAELDGRYWSYETAQGFTGRVLGLFAEEGSVRFSDITYSGHDPR